MGDTTRPATGRETVEERLQRGKSRRGAVPRSGHAVWSPAPNRADPVALLEGQNKDRLPWLAPVRRGRMMVSPFTFYRGAARIMAADLAHTPVSGLTVQVCGDAHLSNFGSYASPERTLVFDVNDFDETLPGPWEWDVKRLAASFMIAAQQLELDEEDCRAATAGSVESYRRAMADFAGMDTLDLWYAHLPVGRIAERAGGKRAKRITKFQRKAESKDSLQALSKLGEKVDGAYRIRSDPPVLVPLRDVPDAADADTLDRGVRESFERYRSTVGDDQKRLLDRLHPVDIALKVVGVGSVGTRCLILLLHGRDRDDAVFLQIKEATTSVLEEHLPAGRYKNHGRRVVEGQRLMQAVSDIFLGWSRDLSGHHYYWRQLKDWKGSVGIDDVDLSRYAVICGRALARCHARSGDPVAISGYLGKGNNFDRAVTTFAEGYAAQNRADHAAYVTAVRDGRLEADEDH